HLDLTGAKGRTPPTPDFTAWLRQVIAFRRERTVDQVQADGRTGIADCTRFGTTSVGDITADGRRGGAGARAPVNGRVFREMLGLTRERAAVAWDDAFDWAFFRPNADNCKPGFSPHAPYSARTDLYRGASAGGWPVTTHLAESDAEVELIRERRGPFET